MGLVSRVSRARAGLPSVRSGIEAGAALAE